MSIATEIQERVQSTVVKCKNLVHEVAEINQIPSAVFEKICEHACVITPAELIRLINERIHLADSDILESTNLISGRETFVILYHPGKLNYIVERIGGLQGNVETHPVIAARIQQGYIVVNEYTSGGALPDRSAVHSFNRRYRLRVDD